MLNEPLISLLGEVGVLGVFGIGKDSGLCAVLPILLTTSPSVP